jgi:hypothetical protein
MNQVLLSPTRPLLFCYFVIPPESQGSSAFLSSFCFLFGFPVPYYEGEAARYFSYVLIISVTPPCSNPESASIPSQRSNFFSLFLLKRICKRSL